MAPAAIPSTPQASGLTVPADSSVWDRISTWVSENKAVVYTIAGVAVVVTGAGAVYYVQSSGQVRLEQCPALFDPRPHATFLSRETGTDMLTYLCTIGVERWSA